MMYYMLILFGSSIIGLLLMILSCLLIRRIPWLIGIVIVSVLLHLISTVIIYDGGLGYTEPSAEQVSQHHQFAAFYFFVGFTFLIIPFLAKLMYLPYLAKMAEDRGGGAKVGFDS